jgi:glycine cleavage system H protein
VVPIRFSAEHAWIKMDEDGTASVGISDYAQEQLGDIVFVETPDEGREILANEEIGIIESVKTTGELHAPVGGTVLEINKLLSERPEIVNASALDDGWLFRMQVDDEGELDELMDEDDYRDFVDSLE